MFDKPKKPKYVIYCDTDTNMVRSGRVTDVLKNEIGDVECYVVDPHGSLDSTYVQLKQVFHTAEKFEDVLGLLKPFEVINERIMNLTRRVNKLEVQIANTECKCKGKCHGKS